MIFVLQVAFGERDQPKIIIVGAGVSGIAAATRLIENGFTNLKILEAEDRIGGRVHSVTTGNWTVDMGGHWVHGEGGNVVYEIAAPLGLLDNNTKDYANEILVFSDKFELKSDHISLSEGVYNDPEILTTNDSLFHFMLIKLTPIIKQEIKDKERADAYLKRILEVHCILEGCDDVSDVSAKGTCRFLESEGTNLVSWKGKGYKSIIDLLLKRHKKSQGPAINLDGKLHLKTEVTKIIQRDGGIDVLCKDGSNFTADLVIVTVSLAVLKERHESLFHPTLPQHKKNVIKNLGMGTVDKIILRFPHIWWPDNVTGFEFIWLEKDKILEKDQFPWELGIASFSSEDGSPFTLTGWMSGETAKSMETYSIDDVRKGSMRVLKKFLSHRYSIPEPVEVLRSKWGTNPHFRGAYSYPSMASEAMNLTQTDLAKPVTDRNGKEVIFFAGEATNGKHFATVHGALESGWREADRIVKAYKN